MNKKAQSMKEVTQALLKIAEVEAKRYEDFLEDYQKKDIHSWEHGFHQGRIEAFKSTLEMINDFFFYSIN